MRWAIIAFATICVTAAAQTNQPDPVIRSSVREVLLDVVIRDGHGHLIKNLRPDEIRVTEDGTSRSVRSFRLVGGKEMRADDQKQSASSPKSVETEIPRFNPLRAVNVVCLVLQDLTPDTRTFAFEAARKFVDNELRPNTFIGVFALDAGGLRPVYPFSNDRAKLLKAVELASINQLPTLTVGSAAVLQGLSLATAGAPGAGASTDITSDLASGNPLGIRGEINFATITSLREIDALIALVRQLGVMPFQKTVLLLGTGLTRPADQLSYWDSLIHGANKAGVTFYAMDVYGLGTCQDDSASDCGTAHSQISPAIAMLNRAAALSRAQASTNPSAGEAMELMHQDDYLRFGVLSAVKQEAMDELADRTGGFLIADTNNTDLLARVMEEVDTHYEISYEPASAIDDGHFRKIAVTVNRPGLQVQTREGYYAVPDTPDGPVNSTELPGLHALDTRPLPRDFDFSARCYRFRAGEGTAEYSIAFEVPISNLTGTPEVGKGKHKVHALLLALVKDERGQVVHKVSRDVVSEVSDQTWESVQHESVTWEHPVTLPPGRYALETAVVDEEGGRASGAVGQVENVEVPGIGLSDLALVKRLQAIDRAPDPGDPFEFTGKRVLPLVSATVKAGAKPAVYFVVYPKRGIETRPRVSVELVQDGRVISSNQMTLRVDGSGAIPLVVSAGQLPGEYDLRITAVQGTGSLVRSIRYTISGD